MTPGMRQTGKALTAAHDYDRKDRKRTGRRAVRHTLRAADRKEG